VTKIRANPGRADHPSRAYRFAGTVWVRRLSGAAPSNPGLRNCLASVSWSATRIPILTHNDSLAERTMIWPGAAVIGPIGRKSAGASGSYLSIARQSRRGPSPRASSSVASAASRLRGQRAARASVTGRWLASGWLGPGGRRSGYGHGYEVRVGGRLSATCGTRGLGQGHVRPVGQESRSLIAGRR
jgi:hypothetical protein